MAMDDARRLYYVVTNPAIILTKLKYPRCHHSYGRHKPQGHECYGVARQDQPQCALPRHCKEILHGRIYLTPAPSL